MRLAGAAAAQKRSVGCIDDLERERPGTKAIMLAALQNVRPSHLLDARLWKDLGIHSASSEDVLLETASPIAEDRLVRS